MPRWFLRCVLLAGCVGASLSAPSRAQPSVDDPFTTTWTAERLQAAGVTRWSDLFTLLDGWTSSSLEGYTYAASARGLAPAEQQAWQVFVDGQPIDVRALGTAHLSLIPVPISAVAEVEVWHVPVVESGVFVPGGVLHVRTQVPERGLHAGGRISAGNETGDPGPYRYTPYATPNIDRVGPTAAVRLSGATGPVHVAVHARADEHHATNAAILRRVRDLYVDETPPRIILLGTGLTAGTQGPGLRIVAGYARLQDLPFVAALGREVPRQHNHLHAGASGTFGFGDGAFVTYRLAYTGADLDPRPNGPGYFFDWRQDAVRGMIEAGFGGPRGWIAAGGGADQRWIRTSAPLAKRSLLVPRFHVRAGGAVGRFGFQAAGAATHQRERMGLQATARATARLAHPLRLHLHGSYARTLPEEQPSLAYWMIHGYRPNFADSLRLSLPSWLPLSATATTDLAVVYGGRAPIELTVAALWREFRFHALPDAAFGYDPISEVLLPDLRVTTGSYGRVLGARGEARLRTRWYEQSLHYTYLRPHAGDVAFWRIWQSQPWHQAEATSLLRPNDRFSLLARLRFQSATRWPAYTLAEAASSGRVWSRLSPLWHLDVTAQKRFWHDHVRTSVSLRNALNRPERLHPAGALTRLTFVIQAEVYF